MLYATFPDGARTEPGGFTRLIKLKAHQIEEIHWAKDHISKEEIQATARNTFELADNPGEQELIQLLAEDWSDKQIEKSMETIQRVMQKTVDHRRYQDRVLQLYHESHSPNDFQEDPRTVMRSLSQHFNRKEMSQVYSVLVERGLAGPGTWGMKRIETGASRRLPNSQLQAPRQDLEEHPARQSAETKRQLPAALTSKTLIPFQPDSLDPGWPSRNTWATKIREISADWRAMRTMILIAAGLLTLAMACSFTETPTSRPMQRTTRIELVDGTPCDEMLRKELVFQQGATTAHRMNIIVSQVQRQLYGCEADLWNPTVVDLSTDVGNCYGNVGTVATSAEENEASKKSKVGDANMPTGLLVWESSAYRSRTASGRDNENNIIVYFNLDPPKRPADGASCWLYYAHFRQWHENFHTIPYRR